jgi:hypothetical protein
VVGSLLADEQPHAQHPNDRDDEQKDDKRWSIRALIVDDDVRSAN